MSNRWSIRAPPSSKIQVESEFQEMEEKERVCKRCGGSMYNESGIVKCIQCSREAEKEEPIKYKTGRKDKWE